MGVLQPLYDLVPALGLGGAAHHPAVGFPDLGYRSGCRCSDPASGRSKFPPQKDDCVASFSALSC